MVFALKEFESRLRRVDTKKISMDKWNVLVIPWDSVLHRTILVR